MIVEPAPAKLNLALHVRRRRADGFHELETLFAFVADGDVVTVERADRWSLTIEGRFATGLSGTGNLVTRAAAAFADTVGGGTGYAVRLDKRLPIASGIGGGSADAAATLRALAGLNGISVDDSRLKACAEGLGSDVPACLLGRTALGRGRGELLKPVSGLAGTPVLLVNPGVAVSTAAVFAGWDGTDRGGLPDGNALEVAMRGRNDLQPAALTIAPAIAGVLAALANAPGTTLTRMSGSGATCFALFDGTDARDTAAARIKAGHPDWWQLPTTLA